MMIREIKEKGEFATSADAVRRSFLTVAEEFGITKENCPTNPAFIMTEHVKELQEKGIKLFGLFDRAEQIGFMAVEREEESVFSVRRLAVLPEHRHKGLGRKLIEFACDYAREKGGEKLAVHIMDNNLQLKDWYRGLGFVVTGTKHFEQLPFDVCFLEKDISAI